MDLIGKIKEIVAEQAGIEESVIETDSTFDDLNVDSLDMVEIVMTVEETLDMDIPEDALDGIETFGQFVEKVKEFQ